MLAIVLGGVVSFFVFLALLIAGFAFDAYVRRKLGPNFETERLRALDRDGYVCQFCGMPANIAHHVEPRRYGGSDDASNLVTVCRHCHPQAERN